MQLSDQDLVMALAGYMHARGRLLEKIAELERRLRAKPASPRRRLSSEGRRAIVEAAKRRWAIAKGEPVTVEKPKRTMSAQGRRKMKRLMRERWALARAAGHTTLGKPLVRSAGGR